MKLSKDSPLNWLGGKRNLRKLIITKIPEHKCYVEGMCGGAWIFFAKEPSEVEVINDIDDQLINFYRIVKAAPYALKYELAWDLVSRKLFQQNRQELAEYPELESVRKAKDFYYVLKSSYGGMMKTFGYGKTRKPSLNFKRVDRIIHDAYERLIRVYVENLDYEDLVRRYDGKDTFFYFDPPYLVETSKTYRMGNWKKEDYERFKSVLKGIKGKFMVSLNKDEYIRGLLSDFKIDEVETTYSLSAKSPKRVVEYLIMNY